MPSMELKPVAVPAKPAGLWTLAVESLPANAKIRIQATGEWRLAAALEFKCGPDGIRQDSRALANSLCTRATKGCLIAKIGGSTADYTSIQGGAILPVGSAAYFDLAVLSLPAVVGAPTIPLSGPLFLTMNDEPLAFTDHSGSLDVQIWIES